MHRDEERSLGFLQTDGISKYDFLRVFLVRDYFRCQRKRTKNTEAAIMYESGETPVVSSTLGFWGYSWNTLLYINKVFMMCGPHLQGVCSIRLARGATVSSGWLRVPRTTCHSAVYSNFLSRPGSSVRQTIFYQSITFHLSWESHWTSVCVQRSRYSERHFDGEEDREKSWSQSCKVQVLITDLWIYFSQCCSEKLIICTSREVLEC